MRLRWASFTLLLLSSVSAQAQQQIIVSWPSKQPLGGPISVEQVTPVRIVVQDVNDLLYHYEGWVTSEPMPLPDINLVVPKAPADPCDIVKATLNDISDAKNKWQMNPFKDQSGKDVDTPQSVSFATTQSFYTENVANKFALISRAQAASCSVEQQWDQIDQINKEWLIRLRQSHTYSLDTSLEPLNNYTIHIKEMASDATHNLRLTNACMSGNTPVDCTIKYTPRNDLLTVSGGFLFSQLQSRTYQRRNVPGSADAVLAVNGTGTLNSLLTSLINVKMPCFWGRNWIPPCGRKPDEVGWALSVGPALQLGSGSSGVTRVGLFGGISIHFWKYLFITAGEHLGEFADFPPGFTHSGQDIPASFTGNLDPTTRTSARFAFGLTFRGFAIPTGTSKSQGQTQAISNTK